METFARIVTVTQFSTKIKHSHRRDRRKIPYDQMNLNPPTRQRRFHKVLERKANRERGLKFGAD